MFKTAAIPQVTLVVGDTDLITGSKLEALVKGILSIFGGGMVNVPLNTSPFKQAYLWIDIIIPERSTEEDIFKLLATIGNSAKKEFPDLLIQCRASLAGSVVYWTSLMSASLDKLLRILEVANGLKPKAQELSKKPEKGGQCDCWVSHFHDEPGRTCKHHRILYDINKLERDITEVFRLKETGKAYQALADGFLRGFEMEYCYTEIKEAMRT